MIQSLAGVEKVVRITRCKWTPKQVLQNHVFELAMRYGLVTVPLLWSPGFVAELHRSPKEQVRGDFGLSQTCGAGKKRPVPSLTSARNTRPPESLLQRAESLL